MKHGNEGGVLKSIEIRIVHWQIESVEINLSSPQKPIIHCLYTKQQMIDLQSPI